MFLQIEVDFPNHPKSKRLGVLLGNPVAWAYIQKLWAFAFAYQKDGNLTDYTPEEIEGFVDWPGEPGKFYAAAVRVGFVDECESDGGRWLHNWKARQGKWLDKIEADRQRKADHRGSVRRTSDGQSAGRPMDSPQDVRAPGAVTAPVSDPIRSDPTLPNQNKIVGGRSRPQTATDLIRLFERLWTRRWNLPFRQAQWDQKTADALMRGARAEEFEPAIAGYLASDDARYVAKKHPFAFFERDFDAFRGSPAKDTGPHYPRLVPLPEAESEGPRRGDPNARKWALEQLAKAVEPPGAA